MRRRSSERWRCLSDLRAPHCREALDDGKQGDCARGTPGRGDTAWPWRFVIREIAARGHHSIGVQGSASGWDSIAWNVEE